MGKRKAEIRKERSKKMKQEENSLLSSGAFTGKVFAGEWENDEQSYELVPRRLNLQERQEGLPIKRAGKIERVLRESVQEDSKTPELKADPSIPVYDSEDVKSEKGSQDDEISPLQKLQQYKEQIAQFASDLMEDPEENIDHLKALMKFTTSSNPATSQLAILALIPVFKALAPGYKIRPLTQSEQTEKVSKEVGRLRKFEQNLVLNYKQYVDLLSKLARVSSSNSLNKKKDTSQQVKLGHVAARAACELCLSSLRFFNFREELITIPIRRLNKKPSERSDLQTFSRCLRTLETLLKEDKEHGSITHDVTRIMCKVVKDKKFRVDESVVNIFLSLSLLDDYDPNNNKKDDGIKLKKKDRVHLSKKQKKARKEMKEIEDEMRNAEQAITAKDREKYQAETLKQVLTFYLEILKVVSTEIHEDSPARLLTAAVMEGLSKFGQMANFDLLGDFLEVLKETLNNIVEEHTLRTESYGIRMDNDEMTGGVYSNDEIRKLLLCITAAFTLVLNHGEVGKMPISFDLSRFISTLYLIICDVSVSSDLEFSHKSLRLADPLSDSQNANKPSVNVSTNAELLLKSLDLVFFRSRNGSVARALPFTKRLYISSLQTPEKTTIAILKFIAKLVNKYGDGLKGLWTTDEKIAGEGDYILGIEREGIEVDHERTNIGSAVLWENVLLDKHYCTIIKDGSRSLMNNSKETKTR